MACRQRWQERKARGGGLGVECVRLKCCESCQSWFQSSLKFLLWRGSMNTTYVSPWDEGGGVCVCVRMIVCVQKRDGIIGASMENSEGTACMNACVSVYEHLVCDCATQLNKQSFNYPISCLVGPASIPVEQLTTWAPAQMYRQLPCLQRLCEGGAARHIYRPQGQTR